MKKSILSVVLLFAALTKVSAQNADLQKWANRVESQTTTTVEQKIPNVVKEAGIYLEKSAKYQYAAIILSGATAGLTIAAALIPDKITETKEEPYIKMKKSTVRTACYVGAGVCAVAAICCEITSINYKMKAGRSLRLYSTGTGGGLAYTF